MVSDVMGAVSGVVRQRVQDAIRSRIAGPGVDSRERRIWGGDGERWFTPDDPIWRVHSDTAIFVGGIRALLLQSLHPLAMAGVAGHSGFKSDPWGRLQRTGNFIATTTYAPKADAERLIEAVRRIHDTVVGTAPDGRPYSASDPHLLRWVHLAEAESFLATHQAYGAEPLSATEADRYVAQIGSIDERLGFDDAPRTVDELHDAFAPYRPELEATTDALEARDFLLREPPLPVTARGPYKALAVGAVATLPPWARAELGLVWSASKDAVARSAANRVTQITRWATDHPAHSGRWARP